MDRLISCKCLQKSADKLKVNHLLTGLRINSRLVISVKSLGSSFSCCNSLVCSVRYFWPNIMQQWRLWRQCDVTLMEMALEIDALTWKLPEKCVTNHIIGEVNRNIHVARWKSKQSRDFWSGKIREQLANVTIMKLNFRYKTFHEYINFQNSAV